MIAFEIRSGYVRADFAIGQHIGGSAIHFSRAIAGWRVTLWAGWYLRAAAIIERHGIRFQVGPLIVSRSFEVLA
jgi:hypothetical protein